MSGASSSSSALSPGGKKLREVRRHQTLALQIRTEAIISSYQDRASKKASKKTLVEPLPGTLPSTNLPPIAGSWSSRLLKEGELAWSRQLGLGACEWLHALESSPGKWEFHHSVEREDGFPE